MSLIAQQTTILKFRLICWKNTIDDQVFGEVNAYLAEGGLKVARGAIVDATIIAAPSSTKNEKQERDYPR